MKTIQQIQNNLDIMKAEDNPKGEFDVVRLSSQKDFDELTTWLYTRDYNRINAGGAKQTTRPTIGLMHQIGDGKPENRGLIICGDYGVYMEALSLVMRVEKRKAL